MYKYICVAPQPKNALICRRQGHPGSSGAGTFMPHGVRHHDGETDRQSRRRGRAARTPARTIRMPQVSSIWIPGRRWAPALGHPTSRPPRPRPPGRRRIPLPGAPILYSGITLSDERGEGERAHCRRYARMPGRCRSRYGPSISGRYGHGQSRPQPKRAPKQCRACLAGCDRSRTP